MLHKYIMIRISIQLLRILTKETLEAFYAPEHNNSTPSTAQKGLFKPLKA